MATISGIPPDGLRLTPGDEVTIRTDHYDFKLDYRNTVFLNTAMVDAMIDPNKSIGSLFGYPIPNNVARVQLDTDALYGERVVRWITKTGHRHSMYLTEEVQENLDVLFVTMRISC